MKINFITVCTDNYPMLYARKIINRFKQLTDLDVTCYCITDRPLEINDIATAIEPPFGEGKGWWNKMYLYSDEMPCGWNLYLDIDTVLIKNFDEEILYAIGQNKDIACVSDAINWMDNKYSSSMMVFETGRMTDIWNLFDSNKHSLYRSVGGDQVWTGRNLNTDVCYIDDQYPYVKMNLKFHLGKKIFGQWKFPDKEFMLPKQCKIVDCGGKPKPHELQSLQYIRKYWHEVKV